MKMPQVHLRTSGRNEALTATSAADLPVSTDVARPSRGPGWQRAAGGAFTTQPQRIIEARASAVSLGNKGRDDLSVGQRVFHGKFGYGTIEAIEGNKLEIEFEKAGRKRVLDSFVSIP